MAFPFYRAVTASGCVRDILGAFDSVANFYYTGCVVRNYGLFPFHKAVSCMYTQLAVHHMKGDTHIPTTGQSINLEWLLSACTHYNIINVQSALSLI